MPTNITMAKKVIFSYFEFPNKFNDEGWNHFSRYESGSNGIGPQTTNNCQLSDLTADRALASSGGSLGRRGRVVSDQDWDLYENLDAAKCTGHATANGDTFHRDGREFRLSGWTEQGRN